MKVPPGYTEERVLAAIEKSVNILAPSFVFGCYSVDDIKQEGRIFALELLEHETFDPGRPLENYVYTHIRNRLINLKRNKFRRNDPPCPDCHAGTPCSATGETCDKYKQWLLRNQAKANLMSPLDLAHIADEKERRTRTESSVVEDAEIGEVLGLIDRELPIELRSYYLQMRAGVSIPKSKRLQVEQAVKDIIKCPDEEDD